ncbi:VOC family protein [Herbiconiux sp. L3-i23]|uniref:VOC family protein n=1 Tax=Herbiconiux sp. L3-i23 TaxID=2905871 RepID=UPI0020480038|nr:VOC family protein [Herbiconiux sp. L3-i23]BDI22571.1 glyoxalase [Herbiconiux sp. L3-i23]
MIENVFINLPVTDLERSKAFYSALGWENNADFSDANAASFQASDNIYVMVLNHDHYRNFTPKPIADPSVSGVINSLGVSETAGVDELVEKAIAAGATENKAQDYGFMRTRSFDDPDGHTWEVMWMDPIAQSGDWEAVQAKYPDMPPMPGAETA